MTYPFTDKGVISASTRAVGKARGRLAGGRWSRRGPRVGEGPARCPIQRYSGGHPFGISIGPLNFGVVEFVINTSQSTSFASRYVLR